MQIKLVLVAAECCMTMPLINKKCDSLVIGVFLGNYRTTSIYLNEELRGNIN